MAHPAYSPIREQLEAWTGLIHDVAERWGELMDECWLDLPPEVTMALVTAANVFGDAADLVDKHLDNLSPNEGEEDEGNYEIA